MPFGTYENSLQSSSPIELYDFTYQGGTLRYTSADQDVEFLSNTYRHSAIARTKIDETSDISRQVLTLTAPPDFEVAALFNPSPPDDVVGLVVRRIQPADMSAEVVWLGRIVSARWPKDASELRGESIYTQMRMPGLRRIYSKNCPHVLYGSRCKANPLDFEEEIEIDTQEGRNLLAAGFDAFDDGYFSGGKVVWEKTPGYFVKRGIKIHVGNTLVLSHAIDDIPAGAIVTVLPGCNHTQADCIGKFDNNDNYGGFPFMTIKNPFGQSSVF